MTEGILRVTITEEICVKNRWRCETRLQKYALEYADLNDLEKDLFGWAIRDKAGAPDIYLPPIVLAYAPSPRVIIRTGPMSRRYIDIIECKAGILFSSGLNNRGIPYHQSLEVASWFERCQARIRKMEAEAKPYKLIP